MPINISMNGGSAFRIKRPLITTNGFDSDVDPTIKRHLDELNALLGKRVFWRDDEDERADEERLERDAQPDGDGDAQPRGRAARRNQPRADAERDVLGMQPEGGAPPSGGGDAEPRLLMDRRGRLEEVIVDLLRSPLTPKRTPRPESGNDWASGSIAGRFANRDEEINRLTLSDYIDMNGHLAELKYAFATALQKDWYTLDYNIRAVLDEYPAITDYLIAYGYHVMHLEDVNGLKNFIFNNRLGTRNVANYAIVSAARTIIDDEHIEVLGYNKDDSPFVERIKAAHLSLSSTSFRSGLKRVRDDFVFNSDEARLIEEANIGTIPASMKPQLIKMIKSSPVPITKDNVKFFLPLFITQIGGPPAADVAEEEPEVSDRAFEVRFLEDDRSTVAISQSAVRCAAQLYYSMILGEDLNVFNVVNYFTHRYLIRNDVKIKHAGLRTDLKKYVFSNKFLDVSEAVEPLRVPWTEENTHERTRPAERQMFYRQVFNAGTGRASGDLVVNHTFPRLWKVLILESARYLERAQASFHPDSYVSRQNVMQAVEDLQYNLSTHCTGMAQVVAPLIYAELDFATRRLLMHPGVSGQIVPDGDTWWRVVETLSAEMTRRRPKTTVLYNKAKLGYQIIRSIADYNPATFENDAQFSAFISNVDAFITTQSILQESLTDALKQPEEEEEDTGQNGYHDMPQPDAAPAPAAAMPAETDEWDF